MFKEKEENKNAAERAFDIVSAHGIGVDIPIALIEEALGCTRLDDSWSNLRRRLESLVRRRMKTRLASKANHTLRALTNDDLREWYPQKQWKKRWRSTGREKWALDHVNPTALSAHERRVLLVRRDRLANERRVLRQEKNAIKAARRSDTQPQRAIVRAAISA